MMNKFYLSEINIYPIKSLGGISLEETIIEEKGLKYDRRWMLVDEQGIFITQRTHFELALLSINIINDKLIITHTKEESLSISFYLEEQIEEKITVNIWDDISNGLEVSHEVSTWFSNYLKMKVKLVKMSNDDKRLVDPKYALNNEIVSFADGYPCLIIGQSSLNYLNQKLKDPIRMDRFRPNFVFTGGEPHIEDNFDNFNLANTSFSAVKSCSRCILINIDQQSGLKTHEPLKTLAKYRTEGKKIKFGQNLIHKGLGIIKIGDELKINKWKINHA